MRSLRTRRLLVSISVIAAVGFAAMVWHGSPGVGTARRGADPDVILIIVDTLRADYLGFTGRATARTPNIDALFRRGVYFSHAITTMPRTTPAVASILSGWWPKHHLCREVGEPVATARLLAEVLRDEGYATMAVSANQAAGPDQHLDRGFDEFVSRADILQRYQGRLYDDFTEVGPTGIGDAEAVTREALALIEAAPKDRPLFLWTLYFDPHLLYRPPAPWQDMVEAPRCWELYERYVKEAPSLSWQPRSDFQGIGTWAVADCQKLYDAEIAYVDDEIGKLLDGLQRAGRLENAFIVFTADHGENFGEGGAFFEHGDNAHDAGLRVPLAFVGPEIQENGRFDPAVSVADVMPTILTLLGLEPDRRPKMDGDDLTQIVRAPDSITAASSDRIVFAEGATPLLNQFYGTVFTGRPFQRACINGPRYTLCDVFESKQQPPQLFDHIDDPGLSRDIAAKHPEEVRTLLAARTLWPPGAARERVATTSRFKLVQFPRLEGGYTMALYDRTTDPSETQDISAAQPQLAATLLAALTNWGTDIPMTASAPLPPSAQESMRKLGYGQ